MTGRWHSRGKWLWQQNPFVGTRPFQGLLVILLAFNSFDFKSPNNSVYDVRPPGGRTEEWYVVRDSGAALGESAQLVPPGAIRVGSNARPSSPGIRDGFVTFSYHGWHPELFRRRIVPADLVGRHPAAGLNDRQWDDAFRAGGFTPAVAGRYIRKLRANIARAQQFSNARRLVPSKGGESCAGWRWCSWRGSASPVQRHRWRCGAADRVPARPEPLKFAARDSGTATCAVRGRQRIPTERKRFPFELVVIARDNMYGRRRPEDFVTKFERRQRAAARRRRLLRLARRPRQPSSQDQGVPHRR